MASVRVFGTVINVEVSGEYPDTKYNISGTGAQKLHSITQSAGLNPTEMVGGSFSIADSDLNDMTAFGDTPTAEGLRQAFGNAGLTKQQLGGR